MEGDGGGKEGKSGAAGDGAGAEGQAEALDSVTPESVLQAIMDDLVSKYTRPSSAKLEKRRRRKDDREEGEEEVLVAAAMEEEESDDGLSADEADDKFASLLAAAPGRPPARQQKQAAAEAAHEEEEEGEGEEDTCPMKPRSHVRFDDDEDDGEEEAEGGGEGEEHAGEAEGDEQDTAEEPPQRNPFGRSNAKYWAQRYRLFSRFDDGIWLDRGVCACVSLLRQSTRFDARCSDGLVVRAFCCLVKFTRLRRQRAAPAPSFAARACLGRRCVHLGGSVCPQHMADSHLYVLSFRVWGFGFRSCGGWSFVRG